MSQPNEAWILLSNGERVECLLEEIAPGKWQATPVRDVDIHEIECGGVDLLPGHSEITFVIQGEEL